MILEITFIITLSTIKHAHLHVEMFEQRSIRFIPTSIWLTTTCTAWTLYVLDLKHFSG